VLTQGQLFAVVEDGAHPGVWACRNDTSHEVLATVNDPDPGGALSKEVNHWRGNWRIMVRVGGKTRGTIHGGTVLRGVNRAAAQPSPDSGFPGRTE
jgi:hypothetical protein